MNTVVDNARDRYYELLVDGEVAGMVVYEVIGSRIVLTSTAIEESHRHRGLLSDLLRGTLDDLRSRGVAVTNRCPVVTDWVTQHPEYATIFTAR